MTLTARENIQSTELVAMDNQSLELFLWSPRRVTEHLIGVANRNIQSGERVEYDALKNTPDIWIHPAWEE